MAIESKDRNGERAVARLVVDRFPQARVAFSVIMQLSQRLPIRSFEELRDTEIEIEGQRVPSAIFEKFVGPDLFPVESVEDLAKKVCAGVMRGMTIASLPSFPIRSPQVQNILNVVDPERAKRIGIGFMSRG